MVFVCLIGCFLCCYYCDIVYVFSGGDVVSLDVIFEWVVVYKFCYICVIGGELLVQLNCIFLLEWFCDVGYEVFLEISGVFDVLWVDLCVSKVFDFKMLGFGEVGCN